jgi:hypothetical protein
MPALDMTMQLHQWIATAIEERCMGETFTFDTSWKVTDSGKGPSVRYDVIIGLANPLLGGGPIMMPFQVPIGSMREDAVSLGVDNAMGQLRKLFRELIGKGPKPHAGPGGPPVTKGRG